jgi:hypothetical protein
MKGKSVIPYPSCDTDGCRKALREKRRLAGRDEKRKLD